jgi:hypothetical protein
MAGEAATGGGGCVNAGSTPEPHWKPFLFSKFCTLSIQHLFSKEKTMPLIGAAILKPSDKPQRK